MSSRILAVVSVYLIFLAGATAGAQVQTGSLRVRAVDEQGAVVPGATITAQLLCDLAHAWWDTRLQPDWRPRRRDENQAILDRLGLTGGFWSLS